MYTWKKIPITFPDSISGLTDPNNQISKDHKILNNLFILPTFDELDEIAIDQNGRTKRLSKEQLESIKKSGEFEVDSLHFPGKKHKWVLAKWLQDGYVNQNKTFFSVYIYLNY